MAKISNEGSEVVIPKEFSSLFYGINPENYKLALLLSVIFFISYWTNQVGLLDCMILVLPHLNSLFAIAAMSIIILPILTLYFNIIYYYEMVVELIDRTFKSKIVKLLLLVLLFVISIFSESFHSYSVLISFVLLVIIFGILLDSKPQNPINITLTLISSNVLISIFVTIFIGLVYSDYIKKHYSASIISAPDSSLEYLGNISGTHIINSNNKILFVGDVYLKKIDEPINKQ